MGVAGRRQTGVARPRVADDRRACLDVAGDEASERRPAAVGHDLEAQAREVVPVLGHGVAGREPLRSPLDGDGNQQRLAILPLPPALETGLSAADPRLVDLDLTGQPGPVGVDHRPAQLVEQGPGRLVAGQPEEALELKGRDAGRVRGHEEGRREPRRERQMAPVEDGPGGGRGLMPARPTLPQPAVGQEVDAVRAAPGAAEAVRPAGLDEVAPARLVVREAPVELREGARIVAGVASAHPAGHYMLCAPDSTG